MLAEGMVKHIQRNFNLAKTTYDTYSLLQTCVSEKLINLIVSHASACPQFATVLDLGCGTGQASMKLAAAIKYQQFYGCDIAHQLLPVPRVGVKPLQFITSDFTRLALKNAMADLVFSSMALQWSSNLLQGLAEMQRVLKKAGWLALALPIGNSLHELLQVMQFGNQFWHPTEILLAIKQANLVVLEWQVEQQVLHYPNFLALAQALKKIGATYIKQPKFTHLRGKNYFHKLDRLYRQRFATRDQQLPLTYEILYLLAKAAP